MSAAVMSTAATVTVHTNGAPTSISAYLGARRAPIVFSHYRKGEPKMPGVESRDFTAPDETRTPDKTKVELVNIGGGQIGRYTFQPGWRWSECIKPVVNTESCQVEHIGYVVSGTLHVKHEDGSEEDLTPGKVYRIAPGHDAWNPGQEPAMFVEFQGAANYAKR